MADRSRPKFRHRPLSDGDIRLLKVTPSEVRIGQVATKVIPHCSIEHAKFNLDIKPLYVAISYTWEHSTDTLDISIDGADFAVHRNVYDLLLKCQGLKASMTIWLDAICIDQTNAREKSKEVRHMHEIYREAQCVISWLWSPDPERQQRLDNAMDLLRLPNRADQVARFGSYWFETAGNYFPNFEEVVNTLRRSDLRVDRDIADLLELCHHRYFGRRWVVQEVLLAKRNNIWTMSAQSALASLEIFWQRLGSKASWLKDLLLSTPAGQRRVAKQLREVDTLAAALKYFRLTECFQPRDRIFALIGLFKESQRHFKVDYEQSIFHLACETFSYVHKYEARSVPSWIKFARVLCKQFGDHLLDSKSDTTENEYSPWTDHEIDIPVERLKLTLDIGDPQTEHESAQARWAALPLPILVESTSTPGIEPSTVDIASLVSRKARNVKDHRPVSSSADPQDGVTDSTEDETCIETFIINSEAKLFSQLLNRQSLMHTCGFLVRLDGNRQSFGLAGVALRSTDEVWRISESMSGLVVRSTKNGSSILNAVVGTAHLYEVESSNSDRDEQLQERVLLKLKIPTLLRMAQWVRLPD
jgi:hypothetical protein